MLASRTISVSIPEDWRVVYEAIWKPERFPDWASGLSRSPLTQDGENWRAQGPDGPVTIRFTDHNPFGIMDHMVDFGADGTIFVPLRVVPNGEGCDVQFTLFRQSGMSDADFARDAAWVERDLAALKALFVT